MRKTFLAALALASAALGGCSALAPEPPPPPGIYVAPTPPPPRVWNCTARHGYRFDSGWGYYGAWRYDHYRQGDCRATFTIVR